MKTSIQGISLEYGDALFKLLKVKIFSAKQLEQNVTHNHQFYELHLAHNGSYTYTVDGKRITLSKNQLLIIPPSTPHISVHNEKTDYEYSCLSLHVSQCQGTPGFFAYFQNMLDTNANTPLSVSATLMSKSSRLHDLDRHPNIVRDTCALKVYASSFIYELFDTLDGYASAIQQATLPVDASERLVLLEELINNQTLSLGEIAQAIGYSSRHTARLIQKIYGCSLSQLRKKQIISPQN